jgi:peptidoglycan/xylan/chitin deacetylase (PgdA/CDA1 family)
MLWRYAREVRDNIDRTLFPTIVSVDVDGPVLCLTYDDGPDPVATSHVASALADAGHLCTFFVLADRASKSGGVLARLVAAGHEVALHGESHSPLPGTGLVRCVTSLARARKRVEALSGVPIRFFRPPYGWQSRRTYAATRLAGMWPVGWSVDSRDYAGVSTDDIVLSLRGHLEPGSVVLMHDGHAPSPRRDGVRTSVLTSTRTVDPAALATHVCTLLADRGLRSVTLTELANRGDVRVGRWIRPPARGAHHGL